MTPYEKTIINYFVQDQYYDPRTDHVWQEIISGDASFAQKKLSIPNLEAFEAIKEMLKHRNLGVNSFLEQWDNSSHPELLECIYDEETDVLQIKSRTFLFQYFSQTHIYQYEVYDEVAQYCLLKKRETQKKYSKGGLFNLDYLVELDQQLYSRYDAALKLEAWKHSPQYEKDITYCSEMLPYILQGAETRCKRLHNGIKLNIILEGNDRVRIGLVKNYTPEEMMALPSYLRSDWQKGIDKAMEQLDSSYNHELAKIRKDYDALSKELTYAITGKAPYDSENLYSYYYYDILDYSYSQSLISEAINHKIEHRKWEHQNQLFQPFIYYHFFTSKDKKHKVNSFEGKTFFYESDLTGSRGTFTMKDENLAKSLSIEMISSIVITKDNRLIHEMLEEYDKYIQRQYDDFLACQQKKQLPKHQQLVEELRHIIQITAPVIAYSGKNEMLKNKYKLQWSLNDTDKIKVSVIFDHKPATKFFSLEDYRTQFRVWWSQLLLAECKRIKDVMQNPEIEFYSDFPF